MSYLSYMNMTPDEFLMLYNKRHPQGPRVTIYDRSDTKSWKKFIPLLVQLEDGEFTVGHADYVHYKLLEEEHVRESGDH